MSRHARLPYVLRPLLGIVVLWAAALVLTALIVLGVGAGAIK